jgi:hypothetical protein
VVKLDDRSGRAGVGAQDADEAGALLVERDDAVGAGRSGDAEAVVPVVPGHGEVDERRAGRASGD